MKRNLGFAVCIAAAWALGACGGRVELAQRRAAYQKVLSLPAQDRDQWTQRNTLYAEVLTRTATPMAEAYGALKGDLDAMAGALGALDRDQSMAAAFEGDFDFFASTHTTVTAQEKEDWRALNNLCSRYPPIRSAIRAHDSQFQGYASDFDHVCKSFNITRQEKGAVVGSLDDFRAELNRSLAKMEERVKLDTQAVQFDANSSLDPDLKQKKREVLGAMQEHLFKTEALARRALGVADEIQAALPAGDWIWSGPGLPDSGADLARFLRQRDAFERRRLEFKDLAFSFDQIR